MDDITHPKGCLNKTPEAEPKVDLDSLISGLSRTANALHDGYSLSTRQQQQLQEACTKLSTHLKTTTPHLEYSDRTVIRIAIDMGLFDFVCCSDKDEFTAAEIAEATSADPVLVERILRGLILARLFSPGSHNTYKRNESAKHLVSGASMRDMVVFVDEVAELVNLHLPEFLAKTGYQNPNRVDASVFQSAFNTTDSLYTWLQKRPALYAAFSGMMKALSAGTPRWPDLFRAAERLDRFRGADAERIRIVDIAGGKGHNLEYLMAAVPDLHAELILQDLPEVLGAPAYPGIRAMPHNLFEPQPVVGAHVYVLTNVLHNWPDVEACRILTNIKEAMDGDSLLLIGEKVFPGGSAEVSARDVTADLFMMMFFGAMERTEGQFRGLLEAVGLEVVGVWRADEAGGEQEAVIEVRIRS
ncbi:O-methyltransferase-domain-containing protein [Aspergillus karnatakaensis]|uniref:O-methyltransferase-domain-containing protein n=1 Tax=Aspergillus karnatakaensis TaxID=1810916 RepID=UPI003CCE0524